MLVDFLYGQGPVQSEDKSESGEGMNVMIIIKIKQCCTVYSSNQLLCTEHTQDRPLYTGPFI